MCCCGGWEPHLLPRSDERKRERERGEQLTYPQHLTTCSLEKPSDGLLVYHLSDAQFAQLALKKKRKEKKEKKCHFCRCCSAIRCVLTVRSRLHRGKRSGKLGAERCAGECISRKGSAFRRPDMAYSRLSSRKETPRFSALP